MSNSWGRRCPAGLIHTLSLPRGRILLLLRLLADYVPGLGFVTRKWAPPLSPCSCWVEKNQGNWAERLSISFQPKEGIEVSAVVSIGCIWYRCLYCFKLEQGRMNCFQALGDLCLTAVVNLPVPSRATELCLCHLGLFSWIPFLHLSWYTRALLCSLCF